MYETNFWTDPWTIAAFVLFSLLAIVTLVRVLRICFSCEVVDRNAADVEEATPPSPRRGPVLQRRG